MGISYAAMYAHMLSAHTDTSLTKVRREATHRAAGAITAAPTTAAGGTLIRRLSTGAAAPAATRAQAVALIALDIRKAR